jgi:hypothetical protein
MPQRDVVMRWIEQLGKVVARLLHGPGPIDLELATDQVQEALNQHLGAMAPLVAQLDVHTAAGLLHDSDRIFGYAQLLSLLAAVEQAAGDPKATLTRERALAFAEEALRRAPAPVPEWEEWVERSGRTGER